MAVSETSVSVVDKLKDFDIEIQPHLLPSDSQTVEMRYFVPYFKTNMKKLPFHDFKILSHSNKLCIVTLAPTHPIIADKKTVTKFDFQVTKNTNRLDNKVVGKRKKGGQWLTEDSRLCTAMCDDGSLYTLYSCINGRLVELNENLVANPSLILEKPHAGGYLAIILPRLDNFKEQMLNLHSTEEYTKSIEKRQSEIATVDEVDNEHSELDITTQHLELGKRDSPDTKCCNKDLSCERIDAISQDGLIVENSDLGSNENGKVLKSPFVLDDEMR